MSISLLILLKQDSQIISTDTMEHPNNNPGGFGLPIISDDLGQITGVFLIPNGRPPIEGSKFKRRMRRVKYKTSGPYKIIPNWAREHLDSQPVLITILM